MTKHIRAFLPPMLAGGFLLIVALYIVTDRVDPRVPVPSPGAGVDTPVPESPDAGAVSGVDKTPRARPAERATGPKTPLENQAPPEFEPIPEPEDTSYREAGYASKPYFWDHYASMRKPSVADPNSAQNRKTVRRLMEMRARRLRPRAEDGSHPEQR